MSEHKPFKHEGPDHSAPYPVSRMAPTVELVDLAQEIAEADRMLGSVAHGKLQVIAEQVRTLQAEARRVLEQTRRDQELHRARCNFQRRPGHVYHLYRKRDGSRYFSMLSPEEWGGAPPDPYEGAYRLEPDMSWAPAQTPAADARNDELVRRLLGPEEAL